MKRILLFLIFVLFTTTFLGCSPPEDNPVQIGNPWIDYETLKHAEKAVGFSFGIPETIADTYHAEEFRVMNHELLEVVYYDEISEVTVRKTKGENQDISGDYTLYETEQTETLYEMEITLKHNREDQNNAVLVIFSHDGYSYSLYAPKGFWGDSFDSFIRAVSQK